MVAVVRSLRRKDRMLMMVSKSSMVQKMVRWWAMLLMVAVVQSLRRKDRMLMMVSKSSMVQKIGPLMDLRMELKKDQMMVQLKDQMEQQLCRSSRLDHCNYQSYSILPLVRNSGNLQ
jgi:hypothetical protein